MESMINLNELEQSNLDYQKFVLSDKFKVYKTTYKSNFSKQDFKNIIEKNKSLYHKNEIKNNHSLEMNIESIEIKSIDDFFIEFLKLIDQIDSKKFSKFSWIYTQTMNFSTQWMHNHKHLHRFNKSHLNTQWVCVFYIDIPIDMVKGEGDLLFKNENNDYFYLTPKENDVVIFSGDIQHMTVPNQSSLTDRISYVSNFNFEIY